MNEEIENEQMENENEDSKLSISSLDINELNDVFSNIEVALTTLVSSIQSTAKNNKQMVSSYNNFQMESRKTFEDLKGRIPSPSQIEQTIKEATKNADGKVKHQIAIQGIDANKIASKVNSILHDNIMLEVEEMIRTGSGKKQSNLKPILISVVLSTIVSCGAFFGISKYMGVNFNSNNTNTAVVSETVQEEIIEKGLYHCLNKEDGKTYSQTIKEDTPTEKYGAVLTSYGFETNKYQCEMK